MEKITKGGEYSIGTPPYRKRERKRRTLTHEEKELAIQKFDNMIDKSHRALHPMLTGKVEEISKKERERERESLMPTCTHEGTIIDTDGYLVCRMCGIRTEKKKDRKEKILDLFCTHKNTIEKNGFLICTKCKGKLKKVVKNNDRLAEMADKKK